MTLAQLVTFCDPSRRGTAVPFTKEGFTYATNGVVCIRVAAFPEIGFSADAPDVEELPWTGPDKHMFVSASNVRMAINGNAILGDNEILERYYVTIASLPGFRISRTSAVNSPIPFTFDGGEGFVMPIRRG